MTKVPHRRPHHNPILPQRIRDTDRKGGFAFIPNRFLHDGFLASLTDSERSLYHFLVLASDRNGISFYNFDRVCSILEMTLDVYIATRNSLIKKDLLAYDGLRFQILALPDLPVTTPSAALQTEDDFEQSDPATIRQCIRDSLTKP
jgi:hypothetical protein